MNDSHDQNRTGYLRRTLPDAHGDAIAIGDEVYVKCVVVDINTHAIGDELNLALVTLLPVAPGHLGTPFALHAEQVVKHPQVRRSKGVDG